MKECIEIVICLYFVVLKLHLCFDIFKMVGGSGLNIDFQLGPFIFCFFFFFLKIKCIFYNILFFDRYVNWNNSKEFIPTSVVVHFKLEFARRYYYISSINSSENYRRTHGK